MDGGLISGFDPEWTPMAHTPHPVAASSRDAATPESVATPNSAVAPVRVHMTGAEWFATTRGGLNRYFTDLFDAMTRHPGVDVSASAFGTPSDGGNSLGPAAGSTFRRVRTAFGDRIGASENAVLDRHFALYGPPRRGFGGKRPLVVHFHGPWADESRMSGESERAVRAKYLLERLRYSGADRYVVLSEHFRALLADRYHVRPEHIRVVPPGVDLTRFVPAPSSRRPMFLCVRRLEKRMGIDVLIDAWRQVVAGYPDAQLVIVGTGSEESSLRGQVHDHGLTGSVTFEGNASDQRLAELYREALATVVPTVSLEGFGLIALESMAAGRAPIVTDCGGLPDSVRDFDPSLIVAPGDADALADRLCRALTGDLPDPARCRAQAEKFTWDVAVDRHIAMYRELC